VIVSLADAGTAAHDWLIDLDRTGLDYMVLLTLALLALTAYLLFRVGAVGWALRHVGRLVRGGIRLGFRLWERLLSWAAWPLFLAITLALLVVGGTLAGSLPAVTIACAGALLFMGVTACLAYMFIDLERYEVERGYKAIHNPLKGQDLALHLVKYGHRVGVPLLAAASVAMIGGFALLNEGLYESVGHLWYRAGEGDGTPGFADFLVNALLQLLRVVDVLDLADSRHLVRAAYVRQVAWPATALLVFFRGFFTLVLLQQIFASIRQGKLLAETITDFWSPHEPIHERARNSLPQYGPTAIGPLLLSLRSVTSLTKEQRDQLPLIIATIGPSTIPILTRHLGDPHEHVRAVAAAALGQLRALDAVRPLATLAADPSDVVRQATVEALGLIVGAGSAPVSRKRRLRRLLQAAPCGRKRWRWWKRPAAPVPAADLTGAAVAALRAALDDAAAAVRTQAAVALGRVGPAAAAAVPRLIALFRDPDETVRCQAAEALGRVGAASESVAALVGLLADASVAVKISGARALGSLRKAAAPAVPSLVPLLKDPDEAVRTAAAEAIARIGALDGPAAETLVEGLASPDNVVRAQTAEALATIGPAAQEAAPALVEVLSDDNDVVRARAVEALGKMGEAAAEVAVPGLVRALRDEDNWVSALAAEALGQMGESADEAVPALVRSLGHANPLVRANAASALGRMGEAAARARPALERACHDEDGAARGEAVRALGALGGPTPTSRAAVQDGLRDDDPRVRAAAIEAVGRWGEAEEALLGRLLALLDDPNDQVKVEAARALPRLAGATPDVVGALCRRLQTDDSAWVQEHAALALGKLGKGAVAAGEALLRVAQTGEAGVREEAMRALALIQPPQAPLAFAAGLTDASGEVRKIASGGWMKQTTVPEEVIPALVTALTDPEAQVRANAAHALARLDNLPAEAVPRLVECAGDASDGLRMNAVMALTRAPAAEVAGVMSQLVQDANPRVRLMAAGSLLASDPGNARAAVVLREALADPAVRMRKAALELIESLGDKGRVFLDDLHRCAALEEGPELAGRVARLVNRLVVPADGGAILPRLLSSYKATEARGD
jgi:HEAT repeat protein